MSYDLTKKFIFEHAKKEALYKIEYKRKLKTKKFSESEIFCLKLFFLCKNLSDRENYFYNPKHLLKDMGAVYTEEGFYYINKDFGSGLFCNANAMFHDVYCEEEECHVCAYTFATTFIGDVALKSGIINPYHLQSGILHTVCEFDMKGKTFVFDGANYLIMEKDLYYSLFNFKDVQTITQERLLKDISLISSSSTILKVSKTNKQYKLAQGVDSIKKYFAGFGFLLYLYDRDAAMDDSLPLSKKYERNKRTMTQLNAIINKINKKTNIEENSANKESKENKEKENEELIVN